MKGKPKNDGLTPHEEKLERAFFRRQKMLRWRASKLHGKLHGLLAPHSLRVRGELEDGIGQSVVVDEADRLIPGSKAILVDLGNNDISVAQAFTLIMTAASAPERGPKLP